jgi:predicted GTPase
MPYGSGTIVAQRHGTAEMADPRPCAQGTLIEIFAHFPWVEHALPAMGCSESQLDDLTATITAIDCDTIIVASLVDLARLIALAKRHCRVRYDLEEIGHPALAEVISDLLRNTANRK